LPSFGLDRKEPNTRIVVGANLKGCSLGPNQPLLQFCMNSDPRLNTSLKLYVDIFSASTESKFKGGSLNTLRSKAVNLW